MEIIQGKLSSDLKQLFELSIDTAIALMEQDRKLLPFMFKQKSNSREHIVFTGEENSSNKIVHKALEATLRDQSTIRFVLTYLGILTTSEGHRSTAVILEGSEKGLEEGFVFGKRYEQNENGIFTWLIGNDFLKSTPRLKIL